MSILNLFNLEGEVAVVTGAGKGIGKGIALALAEAGADVVVASRSEDQLNDVAKEIKAIGKNALVVPTNVIETVNAMHVGKKKNKAYKVCEQHLRLQKVEKFIKTLI